VEDEGRADGEPVLLPFADVSVSGAGPWDYGPRPRRAVFAGIWPPEDGTRPKIRGGGEPVSGERR
jgi:hypothetical protein